MVKKLTPLLRLPPVYFNSKMSFSASKRPAGMQYSSSENRDGTVWMRFPFCVSVIGEPVWDPGLTTHSSLLLEVNLMQYSSENKNYFSIFVFFG